MFGDQYKNMLFPKLPHLEEIGTPDWKQHVKPLSYPPNLLRKVLNSSSNVRLLLLGSTAELVRTFTLGEAIVPPLGSSGESTAVFHWMSAPQTNLLTLVSQLGVNTSVGLGFLPTKKQLVADTSSEAGLLSFWSGVLTQMNLLGSVNSILVQSSRMGKKLDKFENLQTMNFTYFHGKKKWFPNQANY